MGWGGWAGGGVGRRCVCGCVGWVRNLPVGMGRCDLTKRFKRGQHRSVGEAPLHMLSRVIRFLVNVITINYKKQIGTYQNE